MAHAPLLRNNTAPVFESTQSSFKSMFQTKMVGGAPRGSQLSGSTAYAGSSNTSLGSLSSAATAVPGSNGGPVMATTNIINQKADASRSLYQICLSLGQRLRRVPDFAPYLEQLDPLDPVDPLWNLFRTGYPLLTIYNSLQPTEPLKVEDPNASESKKSKIAIFKFVQACMKELQVPPAQSFVITDLMGNDTSGFVKVTQVVNYVLDSAERRGLLLQLQPYPEEEPAATIVQAKMSHRDHVIKEMLDTERKYVQDLENLHDLKTTLEGRNLPGDVMHQIFFNINAILDLQRRFLIRMETTLSMPKAVQRWGAPFTFYEESFQLYNSFIANQRKAAHVASLVFDQIHQSGHPVATDLNTLDGFLLKPMQRLVKYPLLLRDLARNTEDPDIQNDLWAGVDAAERILKRSNEAVDRDMLDETLEELMLRVDDWKALKVETFGKLMMHGQHIVITAKNDQEKDRNPNVRPCQYEIYLFESILLCCKDASGKKDKTRSTSSKINPHTKTKTTKLQLKGRIFMTNVTDIVSLSKPGSHSVQIWWRGDPGVENFTIKFLHEELMRKWAVCLEAQRKENAPRYSQSHDSIVNDFAWTRDHAAGLENPYLQQEEDDDDYGTSTTASQYSVPRTSSNSSLRQRSATGESTQSLAGIARAPPPRIPLPLPPTSLSLQTQSSGAPSPGSRFADSYFSPVAESPASSRTSTTSGIFPGPACQPLKTGMPQSVWDDPRYAPGHMPRAPSRDGPSPMPYGMNGSKNPRGPSLPVMATHSQTAAQQQQQQRSRSYSTPDANVAGVARQRHPSQSHIPAVPGIPQHLHAAYDGNASRSQAGTPRNELPIRTSTQSPGAQRMHQHSGSLGGNLSHLAGQPIYSRGTTPGPTGGNSLRVDSAAANSRTVTPSMGTGNSVPPTSNSLASPDMPMPTQLKVRVNCESGTYVTLVVACNITYQSLIDRIDAKLARFMPSSIGKGMLKLRYRDEDGDFVTIQSDDDIQIAFMEWLEGTKALIPGGVGEIELFCIGEGQ
ncbi:hypothetical protein E4U38_006197 [Claviceps purpurea]|nr:hypothetical protein E4U38_006197 [Claviceps purpurea]KAG6133779.1 hypothetical protein E4U12_002609 [Claviceps purpurea]KAG6151032.1 hypothetical protein E4U11_008020 [Claviceps purpurea]KAG6155813.1 hypothetical protein E4U37_000834 [Claviceps purpurea]KAG6178634.1 hypothetical protein E4U36_006267 [Claviceps purpurea]